MDRSFRDQEATPQKIPKVFLTSLPVLASFMHWLTGFIQWTEEEQEAAGIYIDRLGDE